jgi:hypothetical protein
MMDLAELWWRLGSLGAKLWVWTEDGTTRLKVQAPRGFLTPELRAALAFHSDALLAALAAARASTPPEPPFVRGGHARTIPPLERGGRGGFPSPREAERGSSSPPSRDRGWRRIVALWPVDWRALWGRRANELQARGERWDVAEWVAFRDTVPDLVAAEDRGEVPPWDYPALSAHDGLSDAEAVAAIDRAFAPVRSRRPPARRDDAGP